MTMKCPSCMNEFNNSFKFCPEDGTKLVTAASLNGRVHILPPPYDDPYGIWEVTTEGDEEGRTTRRLGAYEGYLDDIAAEFADEAMYSLSFSKRKKPKIVNPKPKRAYVSISIDARTYDLSSEDRQATLADLLKTRPVYVTKGSYYNSVNLNFKKFEEGK